MFSSSDTEEEPNDEDDDEEAGYQIEVETVGPYRDSDSELEPEQLRSISDFELFSWPLLHSPMCGVAVAGTLWPGMAELSTTHPVMTTVGPIIGKAGGDAVADEQRRQSPGLQTCQAGLEAEDAAESLRHPSLGSDPRPKGSKSQNILLKVFLTSLSVGFKTSHIKTLY